MRRRRRSLLLAAVLAALVAVAAVAVAQPGGSSAPAPGARAAAPVQDVVSDPLPRRSRAKVVEPVAGETAESAALATEEPATASAPEPESAPEDVPPLEDPDRDGPTGDAAISDAEVLPNGIALPPLEAPAAVRAIIEAGNQIARTPYLWGGGHGKWQDKGYDCSGSVSYALAAAGLMNAPLASGPFMKWGKPGKGKWVTIYTNPGHIYLVVAGVRFDTTGRRSTGSRWQKSMRGGGGFVVRHPPGL